MTPPEERWKYSHGLLLPKEFVEEADDRLEEIILRLPCYEPTGLQIEFKVRDILRHMLILGGTGAGKTTLLNQVWRELISYRSPKTGQPCGLLILDSQGGNAVDHIRQLAAEAGRPSDVLVLSPEENHFNPLGDLNSFTAIEQAASKIISATRFSGDSVSENDSYWSENTRNLIITGLLLPLVTNQDATLIGVLRTISSIFLAPEWSPESKDLVKRFEEIVVLANPHLSSGIRTMLEMAQITLTGWGKFDSRTKSILRSCVAITISPFLATSALAYWDPTKGSPINPADALKGKIVIVSCSAATEPETTALLSKLVKIEFYGAAQKRRSLGSHHLAGLIMDEFHYAVTGGGSARFSDVTNLSTLRSKGIFVIAATQGLVQLDLIIGLRCTEALLINFSSVIFMRSQEIGHLYAFAERLLGYKPAKIVPPHHLEATGDILVSLFPLMVPPEPVCPPGALAMLEPHQALVSLVSGLKTREPVWFAPLYLPDPERVDAPSVDPDLVAIRIAEARLNRQASPGAVEKTFYSLKLWEIFVNTAPRQIRAIQTMTLGEFRASLASIGRIPKGLETIPPAWRKACFKLASRLRPSIRLCTLSARDGKLEASFASFVSGATIEDILALEARWKRSVYPSPLRRFHKRDLRWIEGHLPHLCEEISQIQTKLPPEKPL
jgi:hypothetical protein